MTVISYGGGVQSTALAVLAVMEEWKIDLELLAGELEEKINEARRSKGKPEIKVLKRSQDIRQLELFCSAGWCDA